MALLSWKILTRSYGFLLALMILISENRWDASKQVSLDILFQRETCYLLEGNVKVYPDGSDEAVQIAAAGDLVVFPKGMSCTWDVSEAVDKHYNLIDPMSS
ncbi:hypothetical protein Sango_2198500 [Sesamum angolense]|uniref:(S)-ureidoglycine aminohydrolase cupin domain-containing protein n=1 Tax=Sesamum angolense TaxID=2727404 RepID=A0AAE2BMZ1_9LAMI|nr:hypothetical protein Sango_2198500 [Sesamum angolense]